MELRFQRGKEKYKADMEFPVLLAGIANSILVVDLSSAVDRHVSMKGSKIFIKLFFLSFSLPSPFPCLSDEGLWDLFVKDIPRSATSYTVSLDRLKQGVSYEFRVVAVNEFGYGEPSSPSVAVSGW